MVNILSSAWQNFKKRTCLKSEDSDSFPWTGFSSNYCWYFWSNKWLPGSSGSLLECAGPWSSPILVELSVSSLFSYLEVSWFLEVGIKPKLNYICPSIQKDIHWELVWLQQVKFQSGGGGATGLHLWLTVSMPFRLMKCLLLGGWTNWYIPAFLTIMSLITVNNASFSAINAWFYCRVQIKVKIPHWACQYLIASMFSLKKGGSGLAQEHFWASLFSSTSSSPLRLCTLAVRPT